MNSEDLVLNSALIVPLTQVAGPGLRTCIWLQGCSLDCFNCQNPEFQSHTPRFLIKPSELIHEIKEFKSDGITISGGEPLQQAKALSEFLHLYHEEKNTVIIFTGYTKEQIYASNNPYIAQILEFSDCLIAGPYRDDQKEDSNKVGSLNKELIFLTSQLKKEDFKDLQWEIGEFKDIMNFSSEM